MRVRFVSLRHVLCIVAALSLACTPTPDADPDAATEAADDALGDVELAASCSPSADSALERGLALLHHMTYEPAEAAFAEAVAADSGCAFGYWGQAMTYIHPLWSDPPGAEKFERGVSLVAQAREIEDLSDHERAYIEAVGGYFDAGRQGVERPNLEAFAAGWEAAHASYPDDPEITAFHALSLLGIADPGDKSYEVQRRAGSLAEMVLAEHPGHPGGHHYAIHAYDYPPLAEQAVPIAHSYAEIAPSVPHALHMPTHIFTRLGMWDASIELNDRSARAAREHPVNGAISLHFFHALDYVAYAHLQRAEWTQARAVLDTLRAVDGRLMVEIATPYTLAAVPARVALETGAWATAAALPARVPADYPWDDFPAVEAITHFARGIGAARSGDPEAARASAARLTELRDAAGRISDYWATQVEVQRVAVVAWAAHAAGNEDEGLRLMREATELEATTEKHPVTPGEIVPAPELLGEMLLELDRYEEAGEAFAAALERSPRRLRSLYGAGLAAELAGDTVTAGERYRELLELTESGDPDTEAVRHARKFTASA